jgi:hypothetical protein
MKKLSMFFFIILFCQSCSCQSKKEVIDIYGVWQVNSHEIGAAYLDNYQFLKDGTFRFNINEYDELKKIVSIKGYYEVFVDSISFKPESFIEIVGGNHIIRSKTTSLHDSWSLLGHTGLKESIIVNKEVFFVSFEVCDSVKLIPCILLDGNRYYRIFKEVNDY